MTEMHADDLMALGRFLEGFIALAKKSKIDITAASDYGHVELWHEGEVVGHLLMNDNLDYVVEVGP